MSLNKRPLIYLFVYKLNSISI